MSMRNRTSRRLMRHAAVGASALLAALAGQAGWAGSAAARPGDKGPAPVPPAAVARPGSVVPAVAVKGFTSVYVGFTADPNSQTSATASCPAGTNVVGGGVIVNVNLVYVNGSFAMGTTAWTVYVNNTSNVVASDLRMFAVCGKKISQYQVVVGEGVDNPKHTQTTATATCPSGTVPLGGGGIGLSTSTQVNLNSDLPEPDGWRVDVNNGSKKSDTATAVVVCGVAPTGYQQVSNPGGTSAPPDTGGNIADNVSCPSGTAALSGGGYSNSSAQTVNLTQSAPLHTDNVTWDAQISNRSPNPTAITAYAVCARTTS